MKCCLELELVDILKIIEVFLFIMLAEAHDLDAGWGNFKLLGIILQIASMDL